MKNNPQGSDKGTSAAGLPRKTTPSELRSTGLAEPRFRHEIGSDVVLTGRIHFPADARVDGRLRGEVHADTLLLIGPQAKVEARIRARHLIIEGTLSGDIIESGHVELRATARMIGSIEARSLHIAAGARFEGTTRTLP